MDHNAFHHLNGANGDRRARSCRALFALSFAVPVMACDANVDPVDTAAQEQRGPLGKADASGQCAAQDTDLCGGKSRGACWCDEQCASFGDCCADYSATCEGDEGDQDTDGPIAAACTFASCSLTGEVVPVPNWGSGYKRGIAMTLLGEQPLLFVSNDSGGSFGDPNRYGIVGGARQVDGSWAAHSSPFPSRFFEAETLPDGTACLAGDWYGAQVSCWNGSEWIERTQPTGTTQRAQGLLELSFDASGDPLVLVTNVGAEPLARQPAVSGAQFAVARRSDGEHATAARQPGRIVVGNADGTQDFLPFQGDFIEGLSIAFDGSDRPFVAYYDLSEQQVVLYSQADDNSWSSAVVMQDFAPGQRPRVVKLATDPDGQVWMVHADATELSISAVAAGEVSIAASTPLIGKIMPDDQDASLEVRFDAQAQPHIVTYGYLGVGGSGGHYGYYHLAQP